MRITVYFDDELCLGAVKICYEAPNGMLPADLVPKPPTADPGPEFGFRRRQGMAVVTGQV